MFALSPVSGAVGAAAAALSVLAHAVAPVAGVNATAAAILLLTVLVRLLLVPLGLARVRAARRRAASPLPGCLPALAQAPFAFVLYRLFSAPPAGTDLTTASLFGVPLAGHLLDGLAGPVLPVFGVLIAALVALGWVSSRRLRREAPPDAAGLARILPLLPYGTAVAAAFVPLATALYLLATTAWTVLETPILLSLGR